MNETGKVPFIDPQRAEAQALKRVTHCCEKSGTTVLKFIPNMPSLRRRRVPRARAFWLLVLAGSLHVLAHAAAAEDGGAVRAASASLDQALREIQDEQRALEGDLVLLETGGIPMDAEPLPARDPETGAVNISGESPRTKNVRELSERIASFSKSLEDVLRKQRDLIDADLLRWKGSAVVQIVLDLRSSESGMFLPVDVDLRGGKSIERRFTHPQIAVGVGSAGEFEVFRGVLTKGSHVFSLRALLARDAADQRVDEKQRALGTQAFVAEGTLQVNVNDDTIAAGSVIDGQRVAAMRYRVVRAQDGYTFEAVTP